MSPTTPGLASGGLGGALGGALGGLTGGGGLLSSIGGSIAGTVCSQFTGVVSNYLTLSNMTAALCISAIDTLQKGSNGTVTAAPVPLGDDCFVSYLLKIPILNLTRSSLEQAASGVHCGLPGPEGGGRGPASPAGC